MRIMLVDDDLLIRECIRSYYGWEEKGYEICAEASNGEEAWKLIQQSAPDIVLTDISMPKCNGVELIKRLKHTGFMGEIIVMSNHSDFDYVKDAMKYGAFDYCLKYKMTPQSLLAMLETARSSILSKQHTTQIGALNRSLFEAVLSGAPANCPETAQPYTLIYARYAPEDKVREHSPAYSAEEYVLHITENEDVIVIPWGSGSMSARIQQLRSKAVSLADRHPTAIISYCAGGYMPEKLRQVLEELWQNADRYFYLGYRVIESESGFAFCRSIPSDIRADLEGRLTHHILCCDWPGFLRTLDQAFAYFSQNNIRPKTVHMFIEDIIFKVRDTVDPVRALTFSTFLPDREVVRYITAEQLKEETRRWIESYFHVVQNIKKAEIIRALYYIHANYMEKLTLQQVADYAGISRNHFCTVFRRETGENFVSYLKKLRIEKAVSLLRDGRYRVQEVASMVGIDNSRYFCKVFQEHTGHLPSDYKEGDV